MSISVTIGQTACRVRGIDRPILKRNQVLLRIRCRACNGFVRRIICIIVGAKLERTRRRNVTQGDASDFDLQILTALLGLEGNLRQDVAEIQRNCRFLDACIFGVLDRSGDNDVRLVRYLFCRNVFVDHMRGFDAVIMPFGLRYIFSGFEFRHTVALVGFRRAVSRSQFGRIPCGERQLIARPRIIFVQEKSLACFVIADLLLRVFGQLTVEVECTVAVCHDIEAVCVLFHRFLVGNGTARRLGHGRRKRDVTQTFGVGVGADRFVLRASRKGCCDSNG